MTREKSRSEYQKKYPYPRRQFIRRIIQGFISVAAGMLTDYNIEGRENLPKEGPLLVVGNHFHFLDTIAPIYSTPYPLEFIGDAEMPAAPTIMKIFPRLWSTLTIIQGTPNLESMRAAEAVLAQGGILAIFPEGHVHKLPLGGPLPGASYLALRSGVPIVSIATYSEDDWDLFGTIFHKHRRARICTRIGKLFGPLSDRDQNGIPGREDVKAAGLEIMTQIAQLLPVHARGPYLRLKVDPVETLPLA
ncbi:MAG: lysophospholipid acyltransferase family protein [Anaerolineaceae bacterium]